MEFKIKKLGTLKYGRMKSIIILHNILNSYEYEYNRAEVKALLDSIIIGTFVEFFDLTFKTCLDMVFAGMEYFKIAQGIEEHNFPDDWIPPIG